MKNETLYNWIIETENCYAIMINETLDGVLKCYRKLGNKDEIISIIKMEE